jgi:hypothetical protein
MDLESGSPATNGGVLGRGEGQKRYTARGSVMFFKAWRSRTAVTSR